MRKVSLDRNWTLRFVSGPAAVPAAVRAGEIPAKVPGCVHTDLLAQDLIEDPYIADNELKSQWIGRSDWRYTCRFTLDADHLREERLDLACDGLDTVATVVLNGTEIGTALNMHTAHRFDAKKAAKAGENVLEITFAAPLDYIERMEDKLGHLPHTGHGANAEHPHNMIRKMACNFGWDWGPDVPTSGVWRPIRVEAWSGARIASVRPLVMEATTERATVRVHVDIEHAASAAGRSVGPGAALSADGGPRPKVTLRDPAGKAVGEVRPSGDAYTIEIKNPQRWWPIGHGAQPLYTLDVALGDDAWSRRIGLRTTKLVTEPDPAVVGEPIPDKRGAGMTIYVNDKPIYCKGADWIPDDCFPNRVTPERYRQRLTQARDANMNMVRVWGGGLYETEEFYDACDELGLMVWQDFCCACACYPEEEPFWSLIEAEARYNITRLSSHPSLVIWNGCNENIWGTFDWAQEWVDLRVKGTRTWGLNYYLKLFPRLVAELDPSRPYWAASPYSGSMDLHPNLNEYGNRHIWDVWHGPGQYRGYLAHYPRLATEFGFHGPPCWPTLERSIPEDHRRWDSPIMRLHNKNGAPERDGQMQSHLRMADDFEPPSEAFDDWLYLAQVMQARALEMGVTWFRALFPWNSGALYWQLNDCWPVASWSAIDGDGRLKPLWYASRRFFADRLVTIKPRRATPMGDRIGALAVYLHNDSDEAWVEQCVLRHMTLDGEIVNTHTQQVRIEPRSLVKFNVPDAMHEDACAMLVVDCGAARAFWWFCPDKDLPYPEARYDTELTPAPGKKGVYRFTIKAHTVLRDVCVFADRLDPDSQVSDQQLTILPGESVTLEIRSSRKLDKDALSTQPVMNYANRFGAGTRLEGMAEVAKEAAAVPPSDEVGH